MKEDKIRHKYMIESIKTKANVEILHDDSDGSFLSWGSTTDGFEVMKKYIQAAIDLKLMP